MLQKEIFMFRSLIFLLALIYLPTAQQTNSDGKPLNSSNFPILGKASFNAVALDTLRTDGLSPGPGQLSKDLLEYYFSATTPSLKKHSIYVMKRNTVNDLFSSPQKLSGSINDSAYFNYQPSVSKDGNTLIFGRSKIYEWDSSELYMATRPAKDSPFDSVRALWEINDPLDADAYPWISGDGLRLYYTFGSPSIICVSERSSTSDLFQRPVSVSITKNPGNIFSAWLNDGEDVMLYANGSSFFIAHRIGKYFYSYDSTLTPSGAFISGPSWDNRRIYFYCSGTITYILSMPFSLPNAETIPPVCASGRHYDSYGNRAYFNLKGQLFPRLPSKNIPLILINGSDKSPGLNSYRPEVR